MVGVAVGTIALVVVMSVFNGLEDLIRSLFASFDAELKIEPAAGKSFFWHQKNGSMKLSKSRESKS